ncbi:Voltage gated chloride channel [Aspergillus parasiticus SU-1]|uniref:Chloride channel protein n=1 Tax=Aspergillus parasiticus (strain ATCC 56775 / NRRL 5862 / SRRC 143 / SU-1) TaxID=1403190 RepID=A0A0F0IK80_ASPPU|nr:Voltage gated chloride channel [Aspergillus parasiticus SU-1]
MAADNPTGGPGIVTESTPLLRDQPTPFSRTPKDGRSVTASSYDGDLLPYNSYSTIDWLQGLIKDSARRSQVESPPRHSIRMRVATWWDLTQGWVAAFAVGILTASVAFAVDVSVETVADWKEGYCARSIWLNRRACCSVAEFDGSCSQWTPWAQGFSSRYAIYVGFALLFGLISVGLTMTTKATMPAADASNGIGQGQPQKGDKVATGKILYLASGSGIPEIKTILSGFEIPHLLDLKVLVVKAVGAVFAVATGMCLGKEGPFVHISTCVGYLVGSLVPKYAENERKMREMLAVACSAGLSVAFGAPIGGVLFSYEEISTYFPRRVLWRSYLCSLVAAAALKELDPAGTGQLVLFETNYGVDYDVTHYVIFIFLGICGGVFGGVFCQANFAWSKSFRQLGLIKKSPVLEVFLVVLLTALLQYPNQMIRDTGDIVMQRLLVDCNVVTEDWICQQEALDEKGGYYAWLISGTFIKLILTTITFGCKVPSGIIIPALDGGALFGRMVGQLIPDISPGIFAMVGSAAFLAGVSRMTVSLAVIMFELTGEVKFIPPFMIAILTAKWVADRICADGVYDLAQHLQGHPFLDSERALAKVRELRTTGETALVEALIPPTETMEAITVFTGPDYRVAPSILRAKLEGLRVRGLIDAGLVFVNNQGLCHGYITQAELADALDAVARLDEDGDVNLLGGIFSELINRSPLCVSAKAPLEYAVEMFDKLGLRYLIVVEEETARVAGVVVKKRLLKLLDE